MLVDVEMPFARRLKAHHGAVFAVVGAVRPDDADAVYVVVFRISPQRLGDLLAAALLALLTRADVIDFPGCMFFFAHNGCNGVLNHVKNTVPLGTISNLITGGQQVSGHP